MPLSALKNISPDSICIIRLSAIGDVCQFLPTFNAIKARFPKAKISWVVGKIEHQLIQDLPDVDFIVVDKSLGLQMYQYYRQQMKRTHYDLLIHAQTSLRANLLAWLTPAKIKLGFDKYRSRELHHLISSHHIGPAPDQHQVDDFLDLAQALGADTHNIQWNLPVPVDAANFADEHISSGKPVLAINACSSPSKRVHRNWHPEGYAEAAAYAHQKHNAQIVLCGGPTQLEEDTANRILQLTDTPILNLVGKTNLKQLSAILHKADVLLTSDSGPSHIAVAVGSKVIALHAATNPYQIGPYGQQDYWIDHYLQAIQAEYKKPADELNWGIRAHGTDVMAQINIEEVKQKLDLIFQKNHQTPQKP